jgi:hypothetical protein
MPVKHRVGARFGAEVCQNIRIERRSFNHSAAVQRRTDIFVWALYSSRFCQFPVFNRYPNDLVKFKQNGTACAFGFHTQPPFGVVKQVLNEEYTRCKKMTQIFAAFPSSLHRSVPAHCLPAKGHFYAPCWVCVWGEWTLNGAESLC